MISHFIGYPSAALQLGAPGAFVIVINSGARPVHQRTARATTKSSAQAHG